MVIDSSAFVAIVIGEPEREVFSRAILSQPTRLVSTATLLETTMVVFGHKGEPGVAAFKAFINNLDTETTPFTAKHLDLAVDAFRRFGKGRHPAGLSFGDCISYALAKATGEPLLFKSADFSRTDVRQAV